MSVLAVAQVCATKGDVRDAELAIVPIVLWVMFVLVVILDRTKR